MNDLQKEIDLLKAKLDDLESRIVAEPLAKWQPKEMRRFNRLLALRDELCDGEVVDWTDDDEKYYVYFSHESGAWYVSSDEFCESIHPYFTSENVAQKACNMLNSGEVEL